MSEIELTENEKRVLALWRPEARLSRPCTTGEVAAFSGLTPHEANRAVKALTETGALVSRQGSRLEGLYSAARRNAMYYCPPGLLERREADAKAARLEREEADRCKAAAARADRLLKELHLDQWQELFQDQLDARYVVEPYDSMPGSDGAQRWCVLTNNPARNVVRFPGSDAVWGTLAEARQALAQLNADYAEWEAGAKAAKEQVRLDAEYEQQRGGS